MNKNGTEVGTEVKGNTNTLTSVSCGKNRNWFLTINNYTSVEISKLNNLECKYIIYQMEEGEECHTPHIHACIVYKNPRSWPRKYFPTAHIEPVKSLSDCIKYCSKIETRVEGPYERGDKPNQGRRTDLETVACEVLSGKKLSEVAISDPGMFVKYGRGLTLLREEVQPHRSSSKGPCCIWLYGLAGTGKSRIPHTLFGEDNVYIKDGTPWWNGYDHETCIIIDDFDGKWPYRDFLRVLDRYKYSGQFKGGYLKINSPYIFITCEFPPDHFWQDNALIQVTRRLKEILLVKDYERELEDVRNLI